MFAVKKEKKKKPSSLAKTVTNEHDAAPRETHCPPSKCFFLEHFAPRKRSIFLLFKRGFMSGKHYTDGQAW